MYKLKKREFRWFLCDYVNEAFLLFQIISNKIQTQPNHNYVLDVFIALLSSTSLSILYWYAYPSCRGPLPTPLNVGFSNGFTLSPLLPSAALLGTFLTLPALLSVYAHECWTSLLPSTPIYINWTLAILTSVSQSHLKLNVSTTEAIVFIKPAFSYCSSTIGKAEKMVASSCPRRKPGHQPWLLSLPYPRSQRNPPSSPTSAVILPLDDCKHLLRLLFALLPTQIQSPLSKNTHLILT